MPRFDASKLRELNMELEETNEKVKGVEPGGIIAVLPFVERVTYLLDTLASGGSPLPRDPGQQILVGCDVLQDHLVLQAQRGDYKSDILLALQIGARRLGEIKSRLHMEESEPS